MPVSLHLYYLFSSPSTAVISIEPSDSNHLYCFNLFGSLSNFTISYWWCSTISYWWCSTSSPVVDQYLRTRPELQTATEVLSVYPSISLHDQPCWWFNIHIPHQWIVASSLHCLQHIIGPSMGHVMVSLDLWAPQIFSDYGE